MRTFSVRIAEALRDGSLPATTDLVDTAKRLHTSKSVLCRKLKVEGKPFLGILQEFRLEKAEELLSSTSLPLSNVADLVGLSTVGSLHRLFDKHLRVSAAEYRKSCFSRINETTTT